LFGDTEAADKYIAKYKELGGSMDGMSTSIRNADPLHGLGPHKTEFLRDISAADSKKVDMAKQFYRDVYVLGRKVNWRDVPAAN